MSFKDCTLNKEYIELESSLLNKDAELPEDVVKIKFKYRSTYLFEVIRHEVIINLIRLNVENLEKQIFYIIPWDDDKVYEFRFDENILDDYIKFMYTPEIVKEITPPRSVFGIQHASIHIINKEKSIVVVADRYCDVLYFYSNSAIINIEGNLVEYIEM
ncbi:hypothetical protein [Pedobacter soli]|uniref:Uncharacterized protein n=1 Tax=Pedobacter soli TaxID=390242 RepID=A0A1G6JQ74_9SPHI|nr:hypothetical protein [Pedobacter soli]SDC20847.1 hypothetical protein SAMN04488024_101521 [Pedobacter soli]